MCGLVGFRTQQPWDQALARETANAMAHRIATRGPDGADAWAEGPVALGHRRLAILDLSDAGRQPMESHDGRYVIAYNGEIYNHLEIRRELAGAGLDITWRGHSDTETLLAAISHWGLEQALQRATGMFAIALWDRRGGHLHLIRDRFGEKPLYYGWAGDTFVFASELKALVAYPDFAPVIDREALCQYFRFAYVPAPRSIWQGVFKLEPGTILSLTDTPPATAPVAALRDGDRYQGLCLQRYWSLAEVASTGMQNPITDEGEGLERLEAALTNAVKSQMISDVPLGAFLSGGVDSSLITALMQQLSPTPVQTFTVGFSNAAFDESPHARAVAEHLGTDHTELTVSEAETLDVVPQLPVLYDEPFADSSQVPTHLICRAARADVTVILSGDAGDELFGGYNRYFWGPRIWNRMSRIPYPLRQMMGRALTSLAPGTWDRLGGVVNWLRPGTGGFVHLGEKLHKLAISLNGVRDMDALYFRLVSEWQDPARLVLAEGEGTLREPGSLLADLVPDALDTDSRARMMYQDARTYLSDDILCKVDRAAMGVSLETRVPFLDQRLAELAWQLPMSLKIRGNEGKWALRQILYRHVPRPLIERPKTGFSMPVGDWLRGPLRDWAEALLDRQRILREGYLDPALVDAIWQEHLSCRRDWTARLWTVLMFQSWLEHQG